MPPSLRRGLLQKLAHGIELKIARHFSHGAHKSLVCGLGAFDVVQGVENAPVVAQGHRLRQSQLELEKQKLKRIKTTAATTLDYVPRFSTRQAGLLFSRDPRDGTLALRALGYAEP